MKKRTKAFALFLCTAMVISGNPVDAKVKVKKINLDVMEGTTRLLTADLTQKKFANSNKKKATVVKKKRSAFGTIATESECPYYNTLVLGKKAGKTTITVKKKKKKFVYTVRVLSKTSVQKAAKKALQKYAKTLSNTKQCAYVDFNGDGVKDLYHDGFFSYYNYAVKKVVTKEAPMKGIGKLYLSPKTHYLFATPQKETKVGDPDPEYKQYSGDLYGEFLFFNEEKVFDFASHRAQLIKYAEPKEFVGEDYVEGTDYYCIKIPDCDQDDYWYISYTEAERDKKLQEWMPGMVEVPMTEGPEI